MKRIGIIFLSFIVILAGLTATACSGQTNSAGAAEETTVSVREAENIGDNTIIAADDLLQSQCSEDIWFDNKLAGDTGSSFR